MLITLMPASHRRRSRLASLPDWPLPRDAPGDLARSLDAGEGPPFEDGSLFAQSAGTLRALVDADHRLARLAPAPPARAQTHRGRGRTSLSAYSSAGRVERAAQPRRIGLAP